MALRTTGSVLSRLATGVLLTGMGLATLVASGDQTYGAGVKAATPTAIAALYETPEKFLGKTVRIDGVVTAVCEEMGCWMAIAADGKLDQTVRFKVEDGKGVAFPVSARGKQASAEGVFEKIAKADTDANAAAHEHGTQTPHQPTAAEFGTTYHVKATGAVVK